MPGRVNENDSGLAFQRVVECCSVSWPKSVAFTVRQLSQSRVRLIEVEYSSAGKSDSSSLAVTGTGCFISWTLCPWGEVG